MNHSSQNPVLVAIAVLFASLIWAPRIFSADELSFVNGNGLPGGTGSFSIVLSNKTTAIKGLLFTIKDTPDSLVITGLTPTDRVSDYRIEHAQVAGAQKVLMIPLAKTTPATIIDVSDNDPATADTVILNVDVSVNANAVGGTNATLSFMNVSLADANNAAVTPVLKDGVFWFGTKGDVKYNKAVDIFDILRMIDIALGRPPASTEYEKWAGDIVAPWGSIDVGDIGAAIDLALGSPTSAPDPLEGEHNSDVAGSVKLEIPSLPANYVGDVEVPINLKASAPVSGLQLVLKLDPMRYRIANPTCAELSQDMTLVSKAKDDALHILLCSTNGKPMAVGEGAVIMLHVTVSAPLSESFPIAIEQALVGTQGGAKLQVINDQSGAKEAVIPQSFALFQNNPNPFNLSTIITYDIPPLPQGSVSTKLTVFNTQGQLVRTLVDQQRAAGRYTVHWNGLDDFGRTIASGVYFYRLTAGNVVMSKKLAIMK